jgi:predicted permease
MIFRTLTHGLCRLFGTTRAERDLQDQVAHYLDLATEEYLRAGLSRAEAERRARVDFGGVEAAKEAVRSAGWDGFVDGLRRDVVYGVRSLGRTPGFTVIAVVTLALGVGANTAMFTVVNAVMLRPLPYHESNRVVMIWTDDRQRGLHQEGTAFRTIEDWRANTRSFAELAFFSSLRTTLNDNGDRERVRGAFVSANLFDTLGVSPALGRTITADEEQAASRVAVISHSLWLRRFGGDSTALGETLYAVYAEDGGRGEGPLRVIGVMPAGFYFPDKATEIWMPATTYWRFARESTERFPGWARRWTAIGRLAPNQSVDDARLELERVGDRLAQIHRSTEPDFPGFATNVVPILETITGQRLQSTLWTLFGAVAIVLLVACANIANLLLARGDSRRQEFAIRRALGARRGQLVRQLFVESMVVALVGGVMGIGFAAAGTRVLLVLAAGAVPRMDEMVMDGGVLLFALAASLMAGLVFGVAPAIRVSSGDPSRSLTTRARATDGPGSRRARGILVLAECTLAVVLLTGAGLLLRSLNRLHDVDPGFDPTGVLTMRIEFPPDSPLNAAERAKSEPIGPSRARTREQLMTLLVQRVAEQPQVEHVGFVDDLFLASPGNESITIPGRPDGSIPAGELVEGTVSPGFFDSLRVPLRRGRHLSREDAFAKIGALWTPTTSDGSLAERGRRAVSEPVVVNEAFVRRFFPGEDPLGQRFCIDPTGKIYWYEIVGVVGDMHRHGLERSAIPQYYGPFFPAPNARADLIVRTKGDPFGVEPSLRQIVKETIPGTLVASVSTADRLLAGFSARRDLQTWLLTTFAGLALALAAVGIYGVVHYAVAERTREIGVRIALGASRIGVLRLVLRDGLRTPIIGIALGLGAAALATRLLSHLVFGIDTTDPATFLGAAAVLAIVATAACLVPAFRATRVDPIQALRTD